LHFLLCEGRTGDARALVSGLGVRRPPETPLDAGEAAWECAVCFTEQATSGWACPSQHRFCGECMGHHVSAVAFARCPGCEYELAEEDLQSLRVPAERLDAFRRAKLARAVDTLVSGGEELLRCLRIDCPNVVVKPAHDGRQCFTCHCGAPGFCTGCRQVPYHYHGACGDVQFLRERWLHWVSGGRDDYHGRARQAAEDDRRNQALQDALARHAELESDERWKAQNCRLCPQCARPISKIDGCDDMVCGQAAHGGDVQPGCGRRFKWSGARPYTASVERRQLPDVGAAQVRMRGRDTFHPFVECSLCGCSGIFGPRFRCIHCEAFDVCGECEQQVGERHDPAHVFEILFESSFVWASLPEGTRVRVVRCGDELPWSLGDVPNGAGDGLEGAAATIVARPGEGAYSVELQAATAEGDSVEARPPPQTLAHRFLQPVLTSRGEAEALIAGMFTDQLAFLR